MVLLLQGRLDAQLVFDEMRQSKDISGLKFDHPLVSQVLEVFDLICPADQVVHDGRTSLEPVPFNLDAEILKNHVDVSATRGFKPEIYFSEASGSKYTQSREVKDEEGSVFIPAVSHVNSSECEAIYAEGNAEVLVHSKDKSPGLYPFSMNDAGKRLCIEPSSIAPREGDSSSQDSGFKVLQQSSSQLSVHPEIVQVEQQRLGSAVSIKVNEQVSLVLTKSLDRGHVVISETTKGVAMQSQ